MLRMGDWELIKSLVLQFKKGEWLEKRQSGKLKTLDEFRAGRQMRVMDSTWCEEFAPGQQTQKIVDYGDGCFIYDQGGSGFILVIANQNWQSFDLGMLESKLYEDWYLPEIAA